VNNDYRYLKEKDKEAREIALSIKDWTKMYDANRRKPAGKYHIMDGEEIREICIKNWYKAEEVDEWMANNWTISEELNASMLLNQKLFPKYKTPDHIQAYYDKYWATSIEC
jgi:DNA polymerase III alpha subunit